MKILKRVALFVLFVYGLVGILLFVFQRELLYLGADQYQHDIETMAINNQGERLLVHVLNSKEKPAIIYFGGNAEPVIFNAVNFRDSFPNHSVYLVNYRGYGGSSGQPTEEGLYSDALAVFDQISVKHEQVSIIGRSLGSGVATYVASQRDIESLALVTPYDSIKSVAQRRFPMYPMSLLLKDSFDSIGRVTSLNVKTLIIIAEKDQVIPVEHSYRLVDAMSEEMLTTVVVDDANHNNISGSPAFTRSMQDFFNVDSFTEPL